MLQMAFVQCSGAICSLNGHIVASHHQSAFGGHVQKTGKSACGRRVNTLQNSSCVPFVSFFAEDGVSTLCTGLLWNVISSKTIPGNPAEIRANGTSDGLSLFHEANEVVPRNTTIS